MNTSFNRAAALAVLGCAALICGALAVQAFGASTDISNVPLSSSSNALVKPNLLFTMDSSGSMDWDYMGDNVNPDDSMSTGTTKAYTCRNDSNGNNNCYAGDPPYYSNQFNGVAYNPGFTYKAGVNYDGTSRGDQVSPWTSVVVDSYDSTAGTINLITGFPEIVYCNGTGTSAACRKNGIDNIFTAPPVPTLPSFAYATPPGPSTTITAFSRSGSTVTATTSAVHNLQVNDVIQVTNAGGCSISAAAVTAINASTKQFSYVAGGTSGPSCTVSGSTTVSYAVVGFPEQGNTVAFQVTGVASLSAGQQAILNNSSKVVTVSFMGHGMIVGDLVDVSNGGSNVCNASGAAVTAVNASAGTFTYTAGNTGACVGTFTVSRRPYNVPKTVNGTPFFFTIRPVEYCYDQTLIDCKASKTAFVDTSTSPNRTYAYPAYVRYCSSQALANQAVPVNDAVPTTGALPATPKCQSKYGTINGTKYIYPRYGMFRREDVTASKTSYTQSNRTARSDCKTLTPAGTCSYTEEMTNFANWYTYYRRRIQMMKTTAGIAFATLPNNYRVGFITINPASNPKNAVSSSNTVVSARYVPVSDYTPTQKQTFFSTFYSQQPANSTPLRSALARAGRYFAGKHDGINAGMNDDPVQYSCQQNFVILTTDGYWNTNLSNGDQEAVGVDGTTVVGNQDNDQTVTAKSDSSQLIATRDEGVYDGGCAAGSYSNGGCSNTLADVAQYYWATDLRPTGSVGALGTDVSKDNVPVTPNDPAFWQHMTTFTLGLADGFMTWVPDYDSTTGNDYDSIQNGVTGRCLWSTPGTCNWPTPLHDTASAIDDLWHAAVNGRGTYFHADNPKTLSDGIGSALAALSVRTASAAASSTSSPNITQQSNVIYSSTYETVQWSGELIAQYVDVSTGMVQPAVLWSVAATLDNQAAGGTRTIYTFDKATGKLKPFDYASSQWSAAEKALFDNVCTPLTNLSQCANLAPADLATINSGLYLVNWLRGDQTNEGTLFRNRIHVLGDTVDAVPVYVADPRFGFADAVSPTYATFAAANASRRPVLYLAANDGMLHAIDAAVPGTSGSELWAYVPRMLWSNLYKLSDTNYANNHQFYVDGSPSVMDVYFGGAWHTVLVGGLNSGGRGYYALDITNPTSPVALWEFCNDSTICPVSDVNLGLTYGTPVITKRAVDGKWVVLVTSGYNNNTGSANGQGWIYVLDVQTGAILDKVSNGQGTTTTPSGLGKIAAWNDNPYLDNTTKYGYVGDLQGNLWRFDLSSSPPKFLLLAQLRDGAGNVQPISTRPELGTIQSNRVIFVGTGEYLGNTDLSSTATQTFYAIKDTGVAYGDIRKGGTLIQQTLTNVNANTKTTSTNAVDWTKNNGWYIDFTDTGERMNVDPQLVLGTLLIATNVPTKDACTIGGSSWVYQFDYQTGKFVSTAPGQVAGLRNQNAITVGSVVVQLPSSAVKAIITDATSNKTTQGVNLGASPVSGRRVGWREMSQ